MTSTEYPNHPCTVCGRPNARIHYNGLVCNGCRVFFFRAVSDEVKYPCDKGNNCTVVYTKKRGNCFACRFRKCKEANMEPAGVGKKRLPVGLITYFTKYELDQTFTKIYGGMLNKGATAYCQLKGHKDPKYFVNFLVGYDSYILARNGCSPSTADANTDVTLNELLVYPGSVMQRTSAICDLYSDCPVDDTIPFNLMSSLTRIFVAAVEIFYTVEEFHQMVPLDKIRLIQHNSLVLPVFLLQYEKYSKKMSDDAYLRYVKRFKMRENILMDWAKRTVMMTGYSYQRIKEIFVETNISEAEMILLRLIALFNPSPNLSSDGMNAAIQARVRLIHILGQHIRETDTQMTNLDVQKKISTLLEIEKHIKEILVAIVPFHVYMVLHGLSRLYPEAVLSDYDDMNTPLGHDFFIRKY